MLHQFLNFIHKQRDGKQMNFWASNWYNSNLYTHGIRNHIETEGKGKDKNNRIQHDSFLLSSLKHPMPNR